MKKMPRSFYQRINCGLITAALCALPVMALAQSDLPKPFDMSPEGSIPPAPTETAPAILTPAPAVPAPVTIAQPWRRYLIPANMLALTGEYYQRSWNIALTKEEATAPAQLNLGYQSAIFVAPESSDIIVSINNIEVLRQPIRSTNQMAEVLVDIPAGLLRTGANTLTISAHQRHRTDCTIESTYDLWTNLDPAKTYLAFDLSDNRNKTERFIGSEDIIAIGVNSEGNTHFHIVAPALDNSEHGTSLLNLSQALAILGGMPNQSFSVERSVDPALIHTDGALSGELTILVGTHTELSGILDNLQLNDEVRGNSAPSMRFITHPRTNEQFLLISGENWLEIKQNIDRLVTMTKRPANTLRSTLQTRNWNLPDAPVLRSSASLSFAQLGIPTQQFSGRRLRNQFTFAVPADFYANAYGTATIFLDAAYSAEVLPGSQINIYVNDNIATTIPITNTGGGVMQKLPIHIAMRHFRLGLNTITIEAALKSEADKSCTIGSASPASPRFALFDSSQFTMPDFGRIGQSPNLAAMSGIAYPYTYNADELVLSANLNDYNVLSASATIMGNLAIAAGRPLIIKNAVTDNELKDVNALFVGAVVNLPDVVLKQTGIDPDAKKFWSDDDSAAPMHNAAHSEQNFTLAQWQEQLQTGWHGWFQNLYSGLLNALNSSDNLRLFPGNVALFMPSKEVSILAAQGASLSQTGTWTVVTAPDTILLRQGMQQLAHQSNWTKIDGRITTYNREKQTVATLPVQQTRFLTTQPPSFTNLRLIATNWLSSNTLSYVVILLLSLVALGLTTSMMLSRFGRRDND